jgi:cysteine-rich repeat protein
MGGVVVSVWYSSAEKLVVNVQDEDGGRYVEDLNYYDGKHKKDLLRWGKIDSWTEEYPTPTSPHGSNAFDRPARTMRVTLSGGESVDIVSIPVVQVSLSLTVSVEEFYEVEDDFVANMCFVLEIPPSRMTIVNVVPGNARRRLGEADVSEQEKEGNGSSSSTVSQGRRKYAWRRMLADHGEGYARRLSADSTQVEFEIEANPVVELGITSAVLAENNTLLVAVKRAVNPMLNGSVFVRVSAIGAANERYNNNNEHESTQVDASVVRHAGDSVAGVDAADLGLDFQVLLPHSVNTTSSNVVLLATNDTANGTELAVGLLFRVVFPAHTNEVILSLAALVDDEVEGQGRDGLAARAEGIRVQIISGEEVDVGHNTTLEVSIVSVNVPRPNPPQPAGFSAASLAMAWGAGEEWWQPPAGAEVLEWEVEVREADASGGSGDGDGLWVASNRTSSNDTPLREPVHEAHGLLVARSYRCRVRAFNAFGASEWSEASVLMLTGAECGDGWRELDEGCDDGNSNDGDGCTTTCVVETDYSCARGGDWHLGPLVRPLGEVSPNRSPDVCTTGCGNVFSNVMSEQCDDGNNVDGDGCSRECRTETGHTCEDPQNTVGGAAVCESQAVCGDGRVGVGENCDDGSAIDGDGCSAVCEIESAQSWSCSHMVLVAASGIGGSSVAEVAGNSTCIQCGNGVRETIGWAASGLVWTSTLNESCDDGNTLSGDGCEADCSVTLGWHCADTTNITVLCVAGPAKPQLPPSATATLALVDITAGNISNYTSGVLAGQWANRSYSHRVSVSLSWMETDTYGAPLIGYQVQQVCTLTIPASHAVTTLLDFGSTGAITNDSTVSASATAVVTTEVAVGESCVYRYRALSLVNDTATIATAGPWSDTSAPALVTTAQLTHEINVVNALAKSRWEIAVAAAESGAPAPDSSASEQSGEGAGESASTMAFTNLLMLVDKLVQEVPTLDLGDGMEIESMEVVPPPPPPPPPPTPAPGAPAEEEQDEYIPSANASDSNSSEIAPSVFDWRTVVVENQTITDVSRFIPSGTEEASSDTTASSSLSVSSGFFLDQGAFGFRAAEAISLSSPLLSWSAVRNFTSPQELRLALSAGTAATRRTTMVDGVVLREGEGSDGDQATLHLERTGGSFGSVAVQVRALYAADSTMVLADGSDVLSAISNGVESSEALPQGAVAGVDFRLTADIGLGTVRAYPDTGAESATTVGYDLRFSTGQWSHIVNVTALDPSPSCGNGMLKGSGYGFGPLSPARRKFHLCVVGASGGGRVRDGGYNCTAVYVEEASAPPLVTLAAGVSRLVVGPGEKAVSVVLQRHTYFPASMGAAARAARANSSSSASLVMHANHDETSVENNSIWFSFPGITATATTEVGSQQLRLSESVEIDIPINSSVLATDDGVNTGMAGDSVAVQNGDLVALHCPARGVGTVTLTGMIGALPVGTAEQRNNRIGGLEEELQLAVSYVADPLCLRGVIASFELSFELSGARSSSSASADEDHSTLANMFVAALSAHLIPMKVLAAVEPGDAPIRLLRVHSAVTQGLETSQLTVQIDVALLAAPVSNSICSNAFARSGSTAAEAVIGCMLSGCSESDCHLLLDSIFDDPGSGSGAGSSPTAAPVSASSYLTSSVAIQATLSLLNLSAFSPIIASIDGSVGGENFFLAAAKLAGADGNLPPLTISQLMAPCHVAGHGSEGSGGACAGCVWGKPHLCTACAASNAFVTTVEGWCESCHATCTTCERAGAASCISCPLPTSGNDDTLSYLHHGSCIAACPKGWYAAEIETQTPQKGWECRRCNSERQFLDQAGRQCMDCHASCFRCDGPTASDCTECEWNFNQSLTSPIDALGGFLYPLKTGSSCVAQCPDGTFANYSACANVSDAPTHISAPTAPAHGRIADQEDGRRLIGLLSCSKTGRCGTGFFCNFDSAASRGGCEACKFGAPSRCFAIGLSAEGEQDCERACTGDAALAYAARLLIEVDSASDGTENGSSDSSSDGTSTSNAIMPPAPVPMATAVCDTQPTCLDCHSSCVTCSATAADGCLSCPTNDHLSASASASGTGVCVQGSSSVVRMAISLRGENSSTFNTIKQSAFKSAVAELMGGGITADDVLIDSIEDSVDGMPSRALTDTGGSSSSTRSTSTMLRLAQRALSSASGLVIGFRVVVDNEVAVDSALSLHDAINGAAGAPSFVSALQSHALALGETMGAVGGVPFGAVIAISPTITSGSSGSSATIQLSDVILEREALRDGAGTRGDKGSTNSNTLLVVIAVVLPSCLVIAAMLWVVRNSEKKRTVAAKSKTAKVYTVADDDEGGQEVEAQEVEEELAMKEAEKQAGSETGEQAEEQADEQAGKLDLLLAAQADEGIGAASKSSTSKLPAESLAEMRQSLVLKEELLNEREKRLNAREAAERGGSKNGAEEYATNTTNERPPLPALPPLLESEAALEREEHLKKEAFEAGKRAMMEEAEAEAKSALAPLPGWVVAQQHEEKKEEGTSEKAKCQAEEKREVANVVLTAGDAVHVLYHRDRKYYGAVLGERRANGWSVLWDSGERTHNVKDRDIKKNGVCAERERRRGQPPTNPLLPVVHEAIEGGASSAEIIACQKAVALAPNNGPNRVKLGQALEAAGALEGALREYRSAVEISPKYSKGRKHVIRLLVQMGPEATPTEAEAEAVAAAKIIGAQAAAAKVAAEAEAKAKAERRRARKEAKRAAAEAGAAAEANAAATSSS